MSWFGSNTPSIDSQIERATDESIPFGETDLATSLEITDLIRSKQVLPKDAMRSLKKRLNSTKNPNTQLSTLHLIDTCVKNGGNHFIVEISSREFIDSIVALIHDDRTNENVRDLGLDLIQNWAIAFKDNFQFKYVVSTYEHLKSDGYNFPSVGSEISSKLFDSSAPPEWEDSDACMICSTVFSMLNRKHHCRNCGGVFCQAHSSKSLPLPHLGITEPVRVCDTCHDELPSKSSKGHHKSKKTRRSKHQKEVSRARAQYDSDDDEDLKKALQLSLRESQGYTEVPIPVIPPPKDTNNKSVFQPVVDDEEDEDMKAAIAASLRDLEEKKAQHEQPQQQQSVQQDDGPYSNLLPQFSVPFQSQSQVPQYQQFQQSQPEATNFLTSQEEGDIRQFQSKVDYFKSNPVVASTEMNQLHESYRKAIPLTPKLSSNLNESIDKYDKFVDMNSKIDTIMRMYNRMLDERIEKESNYQRQQYEPQHQQQEQYPPQQHPGLYQQYPSATSQPVYQSQEYRPPSQVPEYAQPAQHVQPQSQPQSPYQQRQSIGSVQSPVVSHQRPHYSGNYPMYQPPQQQGINPPAYFNDDQYNEEAQLPSEQQVDGRVPYQVEDPFKDQQDEEEEDEFTAPPAEEESEEPSVYEPTPQHVIHPEPTDESEPSYYQPPPQQQQHQQPFEQVQQASSAQQPIHYPSYGQQRYNAPLKVTDVTFPNVPMNKPPQFESVTQEPSVVPVQQKEEQLIEL